MASLPDHAWDVVLCYRFFDTIPQEVVEQILKHVHIVDIAAVARTCRRFHACVGSVMRSVLRRSGIDMDRALCRFASNGTVEGVKALVMVGANCDQSTTDCGRTPFYIASHGGYVEVANELIAAGANVNRARTDDGETPLYAASFHGHVEVVKELDAVALR